MPFNRITGKENYTALKSGDMEKYKAVKCELEPAISKAKTSYAKKLENTFVTNIPKVMWKSLQEVTKSPVPSDAGSF